MQTMKTIIMIVILMAMLINTGYGQNDDDYDAVSKSDQKPNSCRPNCSLMYFKTPAEYRCIKNEYAYLSKSQLWRSTQTHC